MQNVLITGASRGLGAALARALVARGARVVGVAREQGPLEETMAALRAEGGVAHGVAADLGAPEAAIEVAARAAALVGPLDLLVHNASTLGPTPLRPLLDHTRGGVERTFAVNVFGPLALTQAVVGGMVVRGRGRVVAISSDAAVEAYAEWGPYGASKAAFDHLVRVWAQELGGTGVRFLSVDPGEMRTRMHAEAFPEADPARLADPGQVAEALAQLLEREPASGTRCELQAVTA